MNRFTLVSFGLIWFVGLCIVTPFISLTYGATQATFVFVIGSVITFVILFFLVHHVAPAIRPNVTYNIAIGDTYNTTYNSNTLSIGMDINEATKEIARRIEAIQGPRMKEIDTDIERRLLKAGSKVIPLDMGTDEAPWEITPQIHQTPRVKDMTTHDEEGMSSSIPMGMGIDEATREITRRLKNKRK